MELVSLVGNRALAAWLLSASARARPVPRGRRPSGYLCQYGSHRYAVLTGVGVLAVYRVRPDGTLVWLDHWL